MEGSLSNKVTRREFERRLGLGLIGSSALLQSAGGGETPGSTLQQLEPEALQSRNAAQHEGMVKPMRYHQAILVSCEVPWDDHDNLFEEEFRKEIRALISYGFNNLYIFGTAGEGYAVDTVRFQQVTRVFYEETRGKELFPQVGIIGLSTAHVLERLHFVHDLGFRVFQISLPCWGALNDHELMRFFKDVCGSFPDSKFLHYNTARGGRVLTGADYRRIADEVPNLVATKITGTQVPAALELMRTAPDLQHFFTDYLYPIACLYGECSFLSSYGPMVPSRSKQLFEYGRSGQFEKLFPLFRRYMDVVDDVFSPISGTTLIDGASDKMIVRLGGVSDFPIRMLSPYEGYPEAAFQACRKILTEKYSDWIG